MRYFYLSLFSLYYGCIGICDTRGLLIRREATKEIYINVVLCTNINGSIYEPKGSLYQFFFNVQYQFNLKVG